MKKRNAIFEGISIISKISLIIAFVIIITFFIFETLVVFNLINPHDEHNDWMHYFGYICVISFIPPFFIVIKDFLKNKVQVINELKEKNAYLEHAAKIIRHDMHSGINTYIPRGVSSLERRLTKDKIKELNIESPMKMIKEGLKHTQKIYKGVYEFTNMVKHDSTMNVEPKNIKDILSDFFGHTHYKSQILIDDNLSFELNVNESLFCTAIDNLVRNGLKYNDSKTKFVKIYKEGDSIIVEDNGRGMTKDEFKFLSQPYVRKKNQKETGSGLGLNITTSILKEHGFKLDVERLEITPREFYRDLDEFEKKFSENKDLYVFEKYLLEKQAIKNEFKGRLTTKFGGRNKDKIYVIYNDLKSFGKGTKIKIKFKK
jgi:signal transduction histidine kinase